MNATLFTRRRRCRRPGLAHTREPRARVSLAETGGGASCILQLSRRNHAPSPDFGASYATGQRHTEVA